MYAYGLLQSQKDNTRYLYKVVSVTVLLHTQFYRVGSYNYRFKLTEKN